MKQVKREMHNLERIENQYFYLQPCVVRFGDEWSPRVAIYRKDTNEKIYSNSALAKSYDAAVQQAEVMALNLSLPEKRPDDWESPMRFVLVEFSNHREAVDRLFALDKEKSYTSSDVAVMLSKAIELENARCKGLFSMLSKLSEDQLRALVISPENEIEEWIVGKNEYALQRARDRAQIFSLIENPSQVVIDLHSAHCARMNQEY